MSPYDGSPEIDILIHNIGQLLTMRGLNGPRKGYDMSQIGLIENAAILIRNGIIEEVGYEKDLMENTRNLRILNTIDANGRLVTPGLIDSHTHLVFGGSREKELKLKVEGKSYLEILNLGGGILNTVKETREWSKDKLKRKAKKHLDTMISLGTTTVEAKSGYGLSPESEIIQLQISKELNEEHVVDIVSTFLGAHAIPSEFKGREGEYLNLMEGLLKKIKDENLAEFVDVFCEEGVFDIQQSRKFLLKAREHGFKMKIHADEIHPIGGTELAAALQTTSADHLVGASKEGLKKLSNSKTIAVLLPGTSFYLGTSKYAKAREMIDYQVPIALATDFNPGSNPSESLQFVMTIAALYLKMFPEEVWNAVTINAAYSIGMEKQIGSIEIGKQADIVIWNSSNYEYVLYHYGINHVDKVIKKGQLVVQGGRMINE